MTLIEAYVQERENRWEKLLENRSLRRAALGFCCMLLGFFYSPAALMHQPMPIGPALLWALEPAAAVLCGLGNVLGYLFFWGRAGDQGVMWTVLSLGAVLALGGKSINRDAPLLAPAVMGLAAAASGVVFQYVWQESTPIGIYLLRIGIGAGSGWIFGQISVRGSPLLRWTGQGLGVLALGQIAPLSWLNLGCGAMAALSIQRAFPAAVMAGLALDLAQLSPVPMGAVAAVSFLLRFLPGLPAWSLRMGPAMVYITLMYLLGTWDPAPLPALFLGGLLSTLLPGEPQAIRRRGEVGAAQVRLEMAAEVLRQTRQLLLEVPEVPLDEDGVYMAAAQRACGGCPCRKTCRDRKRICKLSGIVLHKPLLSPEEVPIVCRKSGRFLAELHRGQEQLRSIRADRERQREYRAAVEQQYGFAADFLRELSDGLGSRGGAVTIRYEPQVSFYGNRPRSENGDRCVHFHGTLGKYYVLLCDGMGTGPGAAREGKTAAGLLRQLLGAGYPAEYALRSLNSLCALRNRAGAVTADLLEVDLHTGKGALYKWGAAPSYLVQGLMAEQLGQPGPPPGLSAAEGRERKETVSMTRSQVLVMVSDGILPEQALRCCRTFGDRPPEELARALIACGTQEGEDDITVAAVMLKKEKI